MRKYFLLLFSQKPVEDRAAPGCGLSRPHAGRRRPARGAQVRFVQSHVGLRRSRPEESRRAVVLDAEERRAPSRSGTPEGHARDRGARRVPHAGSDDAVAGEAFDRSAARRGCGRTAAHRAGAEAPAAAVSRASLGETVSCEVTAHPGKFERIIGHVVQNAHDIPLGKLLIHKGAITRYELGKALFNTIRTQNHCCHLNPFGQHHIL